MSYSKTICVIKFSDSYFSQYRESRTGPSRDVEPFASTSRMQYMKPKWFFFAVILDH